MLNYVVTYAWYGSASCLIGVDVKTRVFLSFNSFSLPIGDGIFVFMLPQFWTLFDLIKLVVWEICWLQFLFAIVRVIIGGTSTTESSSIKITDSSSISLRDLFFCDTVSSPTYITSLSSQSGTKITSLFPSSSTQSIVL